LHATPPPLPITIFIAFLARLIIFRECLRKFLFWKIREPIKQRSQDSYSRVDSITLVLMVRGEGRAAARFCLLRSLKRRMCAALPKPTNVCILAHFPVEPFIIHDFTTDPYFWAKCLPWRPTATVQHSISKLNWEDSSTDPYDRLHLKRG